MKKITVLAFIFLIELSFGQEQFSKQFSFITDNDLYTSVNRDRYYTSGIFLSYKYAAKNLKRKEINRIYEWKIGHEMYTPQKAIVSNISLHDRPFAAYFYGSFGIMRVFERYIFRTNLELGMVGPSALGRELQDVIHDIYGFKKAVGWQYQISDGLGVNLDASFIKSLFSGKKEQIDVNWISNASVGTVYTNIATGLYSRIGFVPLQKISNSIAFDTHLKRNANQRKGESFLFINPMLRYAFYDATLEGSLFNNSSIITKAIKPLVFHLQIGFLFTANRFNLGYVYHFSTSTSQGLVHDSGNSYGTISLSYLFH